MFIPSKAGETDLSFDGLFGNLDTLYRKSFGHREPDRPTIEELKEKLIGEVPRVLQRTLTAVVGDIFDTLQQLPANERRTHERKWVEWLLVAAESPTANALLLADKILTSYCGHLPEDYEKGASSKPSREVIAEVRRRRRLVRTVRSELERRASARLEREQQSLEETVDHFSKAIQLGTTFGTINGMPLAEFLDDAKSQLTELRKKTPQLEYEPWLPELPTLPSGFKLTAEEETRWPATYVDDSGTARPSLFLDRYGRDVSRDLWVYIYHRTTATRT